MKRSHLLFMYKKKGELHSIAGPTDTISMWEFLLFTKEEIILQHLINRDKKKTARSINDDSLHFERFANSYIDL